MQTRRILRFLVAMVLVAGAAVGATGCGGATAGDGRISPPSTSPT